MEREKTQFIDKLIGLGILRKETGEDIRYIYHCFSKAGAPLLGLYEYPRSGFR